MTKTQSVYIFLCVILLQHLIYRLVFVIIFALQTKKKTREKKVLTATSRNRNLQFECMFTDSDSIRARQQHAPEKKKQGSVFSAVPILFLWFKINFQLLLARMVILRVTFFITEFLFDCIPGPKTKTLFQRNLFFLFSMANRRLKDPKYIIIPSLNRKKG